MINHLIGIRELEISTKIYLHQDGRVEAAKETIKKPTAMN